MPGSGRSPGEGNGNLATHSSIALKEEPGVLQPTGSQRVRLHFHFQALELRWLGPSHSNMSLSVAGTSSLHPDRPCF